MRGLFIKDFCIMMQRKTTIILFVVLLFVIGNQAGTAFSIGYGTLLFGFLAQSTVAYDDDGSCLTFLFTLPVTIKGYVREKFLFGGLVMFAGWLLSVVFGFVLGCFKSEMALTADDVISAIVVFFVFAAVLGLYIPIQLKYGAERSRLVLMALGAVTFVIASIGIKYDFKLPDAVNDVPTVAVMLVALVLCAVVILGAYYWSVNVLKKKEY